MPTPNAVMNRIFGFLGVAALAGAVTSVVLMAADRGDPVTIEAIRVLTPTVEPGGQVQIEMDVDRHRSCRLHVEHLITDAVGKRALLPDLDFDALPGALGRDKFTDTYHIPQEFAPGQACYRRISRYQCNPVQILWPIVLARGVGRGTCFQVQAAH